MMNKKSHTSYIGFRCPDEVREKVEELRDHSCQDMTTIILRLIKAGYSVEKNRYESINELLKY